MFKKITFMLMFCASAFLYGQTTVINDFEPGSPAITTDFGAAFSSSETNPDLTDNPSTNIGRFGRTNTQWFSLLNFKLASPFVVPAGETRYLHVLVLAPAQSDLAIRFNGTDASPYGTGALRGSNDYTDIGKWQDIVFAIAGGGSGTTINYITLFPDAGFNNIPSGQIANNTTDFIYLDNFKFTNSAASELHNTWLGTTADWSTPSNWSRGLPSASLGIIIPTGVTEPVVADNTAIETNYLNIASGAAINISNGSSLIVDKEATSPAGSIKYSRTLTADADPLKAWHLVTSPLAGVSIVNFIAGNTLAPGTTNTDFRGIGNYTNDGNGFNYYEVGYAGTDAFNVGKGFAVKNAAAGNVEFTGFFRKNDRQFGISQGTDNFNLVGNAFLAYMNLGTFFTNNNAADRLSEATIWLWDPNKNGVGLGGYVTKMSGTDAAFEIAPGQAFFVSAGSAASNVVSFSEANQSHKTDSFLKSSSNRTEIELKISQGDLLDNTNLYYIEGTSTKFDNGFDGSLFTGTTSELSIYTELVSDNDGRKLAIQSLPNSGYENMIIPIGLKAVKGKEIVISAKSLNLPESINIFIEDRDTNSFTNLTKNDFKTLLTEDLNGAGRFFLRTSAKNSLSTDSSKLTGVSIYKKGHRSLKVTGLQKGKTTVSLFDFLGKRVMTTSFESSNENNISLPNLATGVYVVKLETQNGKLNKKIILE